MPAADSSAAAAAAGTGGAAGQIVVGVDGSDYSLAALRWALEEGALRHVGVHAVLTWDIPAIVGMSPLILPPISELESGARSELDTILAQAVGGGERPSDSPLTSAVAEGSPAGALLAAAAGACLLVVGSRGHGGFAGLLLGSVSQQCAAHAPCPVVVVHDRASRARS